MKAAVLAAQSAPACAIAAMTAAAGGVGCIGVAVTRTLGRNRPIAALPDAGLRLRAGQRQPINKGPLNAVAFGSKVGRAQNIKSISRQKQSVIMAAADTEDDCPVESETS
jgi:hypothetical protein